MREVNFEKSKLPMFQFGVSTLLTNSNGGEETLIFTIIFRYSQFGCLLEPYICDESSADLGFN